MKIVFQSLSEFILSSSRTQGFGLTIIGIMMLISTNLAESIGGPITREIAQVAIILGGTLGTALLFGRKNGNQHPNEKE